MTSRRGVLKLIGGGVVLAAASAGGFIALNQPSVAAREAWRTAGQEAEYRRRFLSYALLAPNPHNRQPWLLRLIGQDSLALHGDLDRRLPVTDPSPASCCGAVPRPIPSSPPPRSAARPSSPSTPCARCRRR